MHKLTIIPGLLFGLLFAGGGFFLLSKTAIPTWQSWQAMQDWRPGYAKLLSVSGSENDTEASYRYEYGGSTYQGNRVYVAEFKDNIGSYHADLLRQLRPYHQSGQLLPIWINPTAPNQAIIDRDMRWGLFALMTIFCSVFIGIGLIVMLASVRSTGKSKTSKALPDITNENNIDWKSHKGWETSKIRSNATKGVWFSWIFALLWNAVSVPIIFVIPRELSSGNYPALLILLFPLVGMFLVYRAIASTLEYRRFGKVLYEMDPYPGAIGGHVGGRIEVSRLSYQNALAAEDILVRLECVYSYVSGSGKNRSRREKIKWAEQGKPQIDSLGQGVSLQFRFDVPPDLPNATVKQKGDYHFWRLTVKAEVSGVDLNRNYNFPVFDTGATSRFVRHDISAQSNAIKEKQSAQVQSSIASGDFDIDGLSRAMRFSSQGSEIQMDFPMFRNQLLALFAAIFAGGFGFATFSMGGMALEGGLFGIFIGIFGIPFALVALIAGLATIYLLFNHLRVNVNTGNVSILRRLLFIPVYRRSLSRNDISHLSIKRSGSTGQGVDKIEHFKLKAHDKSGRSVTLAEDIDGKEVAGHFGQYLAQRIGVEYRHEK